MSTGVDRNYPIPRVATSVDRELPSQRVHRRRPQVREQPRQVTFRFAATQRGFPSVATGVDRNYATCRPSVATGVDRNYAIHSVSTGVNRHYG